jgi:hypothetical protein
VFDIQKTIKTKKPHIGVIQSHLLKRCDFYFFNPGRPVYPDGYLNVILYDKTPDFICLCSFITGVMRAKQSKRNKK